MSKPPVFGPREGHGGSKQLAYYVDRVLNSPIFLNCMVASQVHRIIGPPYPLRAR